MVKDSKYLEQFKKLHENKPEIRKLAKLYGGRIILEMLEQEEVKTAGGLIFAGADNVRSDFKLAEASLGVVLLVGEGYENDKGEREPVEVEVGNVVLVSEFGTKFYRTFPGINGYIAGKGIGLTSETEIQMLFESIEDIRSFQEASIESTESKSEETETPKASPNNP